MDKNLDMLSVVIPTTRPDTLAETIRSVKNQKYPDFEIIVVDNSINSYSSTQIEKICYSEGVRYVKEENDGLHNTRNRGVIESKGNIVVFTDDDAKVGEKFLEEIVKPFSMFNNIGAVGGKVIGVFESSPPPHMRYLKYSYLSLLDYGNEMKEVSHINGNNMAILKKAWEDAGGFNPDLFQKPKNIWKRGDGESGLWAKMIQKGWKIIYTPYAVVEHYIPKERMSIPNLKKIAFRHGIQMSYSKFFGGRFPPRPILLMRSGAFLLIFLMEKMMSLITKYPKSARYEVDSELYKARAMYEMKLVYDQRLREHVSRTNWIEEIKR